MTLEILPKIYADYPHILLMEANGDCPTVEVAGLVDLLNVCIKGDECTLRTFATTHPHQRVRSAAAFILRKHEFNITRAISVESSRTVRGRSPAPAPAPAPQPTWTSPWSSTKETT